MQTFTKLTLFFALSAAAPHAINHFRLHDRHEHGAMKLIAERATEGTTLIGRGVQSPDGQCGVGTGFVCAAGMCCSQYGFCGTGEAYCGSGSNKNAHRFGPPAYRTTRGKPTFVTGGVSTSVTGTAPVGTAPAYSVTPLPESSALSEPQTTPTQVPITSASQVASTSPDATSGSATPVQTSTSPSTPSSQPSPPASGGGLGDTYTFYTGSGATTAGWPSDSDWVEFDSLWAMNLPLISASCSDFQETDNSATESAELKSAISSVAASSGVDSRFILAIVMQESKGCVRVDTTNNGVVNPGLMQSHDGSGTCNPGGPGAPGMIPCPSSQITQMIKDGTEGTAAGDGLKQVLEQATGSVMSQKYYQAATIYNSGNLPANLDDNTATPCYASDIANRLTGWTTAQSKCTA